MRVEQVNNTVGRRGSNVSLRSECWHDICKLFVGEEEGQNLLVSGGKW